MSETNEKSEAPDGGLRCNDRLGVHWDALATVAVTRESCIAIDAIQAHIAEIQAKLDHANNVINARKRLERLEPIGDCSGSYYPDRRNG